MIESESGDLLSFDAEALVNAVNCRGSMAGGIARQFKIRFPEYNRAYEEACERGEIRLGAVQLYETGNPEPPYYFVNFPTMDLPGQKARIEDIESGLADLRRQLAERGIRSIAIPALGCGVGGLEWADVRKCIESALGDMEGLRVALFEPR